MYCHTAASAVFEGRTDLEVASRWHSLGHHHSTLRTYQLWAGAAFEEADEQKINAGIII